MEKFKKIIVLMMISITATGLIGCGNIKSSLDKQVNKLDKIFQEFAESIPSEISSDFYKEKIEETEEIVSKVKSIKTETKQEENYRDSIVETGNLIIELNKFAKSNYILESNNILERHVIYTQVEEYLKKIKETKAMKSFD